MIIVTAGCLEHLRHLGEGVVEAEAGVPCTVLARHCARWGIGPAEFFAGIPGTVGGALTMNAGAFGGETWKHVIEVEVVDRRGEVDAAAAPGLRDRLSRSPGPGRGVVPVRALPFRCRHSDEPRGRARADTAAAGEAATRHAELRVRVPQSPGRFRGPPDRSAGLKEFRIGGAQVSAKHANFIINTGKATAADIEALIQHVQATVEKAHGVRLVPEVHVLGEPLAAEASS